jgi:type II secretion system protein D
MGAALSAVASAALAVADPPAAPPAPAAATEVEDDGGVTIAVDEATNSLVILGSPRAIERARLLAEQAMKELPPEASRIRSIPLDQGTDPARIQALVTETLQKIAPPGGLPGDIARRSAVIVDPQDRALVVAATDRDFETIGQLIATFARGDSVDRVTVKVYTLRNVGADRAVRGLRELLGLGRADRRFRDLAVTLERDGATVEATFDPSQVRAVPDAATNSVTVIGPADAIGFVDRYLGFADQAAPSAGAAVRLIALKNAKADALVPTLVSVFRGRGRTATDGSLPPEPTVAADVRTNSLVVTASPEQLAEIESLVARLDSDAGIDRGPIEVIGLSHLDAASAADLLSRTVIGDDPERKRLVQIVPDAGSATLLVRGPDGARAEIRTVLKEIDRAPSVEFPVRSIALARADAAAVATAIQRFYDDRARLGQGPRQRATARKIAVIGDPRSATLLVAASDVDFAEIQSLVQRFDSADATQSLDFRVYALEHARAEEIAGTVQALLGQIFWTESMRGLGRGGNREDRSSVAIRPDERLNALVVTGRGESFALVEQLIGELDAPPKDGQKRTVRTYRASGADPATLADLLKDAIGGPARPGEESTRARITPVARSGLIIVSATERQQEEIANLLAGLEESISLPDRQNVVVPVEFAKATEVADTLTAFLRSRAAAAGGQSTATILANDGANSLVLSASADDLALLRDLLAKLDQPASAGDRVIDIIPLRDGQADEVARLVGEQFARRGGGQGVTVTADIRTNSVIVNAPTAQAAQVKGLIAGLDTPDSADETIVRTFALAEAKADEVVRILTETLQLDGNGAVRGIALKLDENSPAVQVNARVVADRRSNSLVITATAESFPVIEQIISKLESVPAAAPVEFRVIPLRHAIADDVSMTLRRLVRDQARAGEPAPTIDANRLENQLIVGATAEQFKLIDQVLDAIDVPSSRPRKTDFVPLRFAEAEKVRDALSYFYGAFAAEADTPGKQNVSIVADPASNSLVISADEGEWAGIRELLAKLDSEEYDASLQLKVIPLVHADSAGVAAAINDAFRPRAEAPDRPVRKGDGEDEAAPPTVLVDGADWVNVSAERQTNSLVISATRMNMAKVEAIVKQLDIAEFDRLPSPRLIPVTIGNPEQLASAIERIYAPPAGSGRDAERSRLRIVADSGSNALIVRAPDDEYRQILAIAEALQQQAESQGLAVRLIPLKTANAGRVADAIREAFQTRAQQAKLPLSVQVDASTNGLVVAASGPLQDEIRAVVEQMDALAPAAGQAIFVIDLANVPPDSAKRVIEEIGLDKPQAPGSSAKVIIDPVKVSAVPGRPALIVVANPADRETILAFVRALDSEPAMAESTVRIVGLKNAAAGAVARTLTSMLAPEAAPAATGLAKAMQEQIRRLSIRRDGLGQPDLKLDLTKPTKITADERINAVIIASTPDNIAALEEVARTLDSLPLTNAVQVQIYPLENISSQQFSRILKELFDQGKKLGSIPGTQLTGLPAGATGKALLSEVVITVDDRTNSVIVAGPEDALALVDVMKTRLDGDLGVGWVEPRILPLRWADAEALATTLQSVLVEGKTELPEATPMQKQVGRLRMARVDGNGGAIVDSDVFVPMSQLVIRPEPQLNALLVVGSQGNVAIVEELVRQLDVEAASPAALVRIYPLEHASASRIAPLASQLFDQQRGSKLLREDDRLKAIADERTNTLIVSTSPRSFAIFEEILKSLDRELPPDIKEIRTIELKNASAARLAPMVQTLMDARLDRLRKVSPETADLERATVLSDGRANALIVAAGADAFGVIQSLVKDLDREELVDQGLLTAVPLKKANLDRVASALNQIMERRYADLPNEVGRRVKPLILTDPRTSSLLVSAGPDDLKAITDLVAKLEATPANPAVGVEVIALASGRADLMAPRLEQLMKERATSLGESKEPSDAVAIVADVTSNSLLVAASPENVEIIRGLADVLAEAAEKAVGGQAFEIVTLVRGKATEIVALLDDLYMEEENRRRGANTVAAAAEERINAVILSGSEIDLQTMRRMVAQLDGVKPNAVVEIKYIPLASANVIETVNLIQTVLSGSSLAGGRNQQQAIVLKYLRQVAGTDGPAGEPIELEVSAALRQSMSLTPDVRTNTIIVRAPRESMELIERMIRDLDGSSAGAQNIRIFRLANADAEQMARVLTELFNLKQQGNLYVLRPREAEDGGIDTSAASTQGILGSELSLVPDERQALSITVDNRTNSLLVSGTPNYLDLVAKVVTELDATEATARDTFVYRLKNAEAPEVARVLNEFVAKDQQKVLAMLSPEERPSAQKLLEQEVTIVGDQASNSVLVNASPRYMERVKSVIGELDIDPPQVQIQVLLAEITLATSMDLGLEFTRFSVGDVDVAGGFGLNKQAFSPLAPKVPGLAGLAPALFGSVAVPNIAIGSQDFDLLLNALAAQGRVELLSNPSVMVANNTEGKIQVGDTVRLPTSVSFSAAGQQSAVSPEEVGVILNVTPSINPDGFVRMKIEPEISRISKETTQISENFESPIINRRKATTTVTVRDGQTVVIGGLVQDRYERIEKKIPLLGDLPLVGMLFRNTQETTAKTELLIVLTPHVMTNDRKAGELSDKMIDKLSVPPELIRQIRQGELEGTLGHVDREGRLIDPMGAPSEPAAADAPQGDPLAPAPEPGGKP